MSAVPRREALLEHDVLQRIDADVRRALATGDPAGLDVLGYGEMSVVLRVWDCAVKRLPVFPDAAAFTRYGQLFDETLAHYRDAGLAVVESELQAVAQPGGRLAGYVVQPLLSELLPDRLRARPGEARRWFTRIAELAVAIADGAHGFDAQVANFAVIGERLVYLDVTTPLLRDRDGGERLDPDLFVAALPWVLRWPVKRFAVRHIAETFYGRRSLLLDAVGNLHKEGLAHLVPDVLPVVNAVLDTPITVDEVRRFYAADACMWAALMQLRRADRWWQTRVRRRPYPFLLPEHVVR